MYIVAVFAGEIARKLIVDQLFGVVELISLFTIKYATRVFYPGSFYFTKIFPFPLLLSSFYYIEDNAKLKCGGGKKIEKIVLFLIFS